MKQLTQALLFLALACPLSSFAAEPAKAGEPPMQHEGGMAGMQHGGMQGGMQHGGGMMHGGMGMMDDQHIAAMQEHILKMHDLSNQILAEKDPAKKEQLKQQQRDVMKAHHEEMMARHGGMK